jgi:hypothetical protein
MKVNRTDDNTGWDVPLNAVVVTLTFSSKFVPGTILFYNRGDSADSISTVILSMFTLQLCPLCQLHAMHQLHGIAPIFR